MSMAYGAMHDLERAVRTHLFGIAPNNSGSSFLKEAMATSKATWNLPREGQFALGFAGPTTLKHGGLIWSEPEWRSRLADPDAYDWPSIRKAWHFQAFARDPAASVFYTKTPHFLLHVDELARHFPNASFLFMVRNPYAVCEGICRNQPRKAVRFSGDLPSAAAQHVVACMELQRRNLERHGGRGSFFTYEDMCDAPHEVEERIRALVPELRDLKLRQRLRVKDGMYDEMLANMNRRQIGRLGAGEIEAFNRVFEPCIDLLEHFGYRIMPPDSGRQERPREPSAMDGR